MPEHITARETLAHPLIAMGAPPQQNQAREKKTRPPRLPPTPTARRPRPAARQITKGPQAGMQFWPAHIEGLLLGKDWRVLDQASARDPSRDGEARRRTACRRPARLPPRARPPRPLPPPRR